LLTPVVAVDLRRGVWRLWVARVEAMRVALEAMRIGVVTLVRALMDEVGDGRGDEYAADTRGHVMVREGVRVRRGDSERSGTGVSLPAMDELTEGVQGFPGI